MVRLRAAWRPLLAATTALALLVASLGSTVLAAAERPIGPAAERRAPLTAEEPDPDPTPTPKPTPWPTPKGVKGLDVSHWNGFPDFERLADAGMRFVFSKATQGTAFVDDTFKRHTREARAAGLVAGAYHFFDYRKSGVRQAKHYLRILRATTGTTGLLPLVVDVETLASLGTPQKAKARARLHDLLDELYRQTGRYPMIYTSRHMWERVVGAPTGFGGYPLWVACWKCDTVWLPRGWSAWDFWQVGLFRFGGGLKLDGNVFSSTRDKLRLLRAKPFQLDGGAPWTADRTVQLDLRGFDAKDVRVGYRDEPYGPWQPYGKRLEVKLPQRQGRQDMRVQLRSFRHTRSAPLRASIKVDTEAPTVNGPKVDLRQGARVGKTGTRVPTRVSMRASDKTSGLHRSSLKAICGGVTRVSEVRSAAATEILVDLDRRGCTVKGVAHDAIGHRTSRSVGPAVGMRDLRAGNRKVSFDGSWRTLKTGTALGGTLVRTSKAGSQARLTFEGTQLAIVARRGPTGGRFKVILDGEHVDTVDLYAPKADVRRVVYVRSVKKGKHQLKLRATGTGSKRSQGATIWLDAVLILDRRR